MHPDTCQLVAARSLYQKTPKAGGRALITGSLSYSRPVIPSDPRARSLGRVKRSLADDLDSTDSVNCPCLLGSNAAGIDEVSDSWKTYVTRRSLQAVGNGGSPVLLLDESKDAADDVAGGELYLSARAAPCRALRDD